MLIQQTSGKIQAGEQEVVLLPRSIRPLKQGVMYVHGAESSNPGGMSWLSIPGRWGVIQAVVSSSTTLCPELAGNETWGNATALSRMTSSYNYLQTLPGVSNGKISLLAQSMGAVTAIAWAKANPGKVDRIALIIPVINLNDVRNNSGYKPYIDSAYGGSYSEATYGANHNPLTIALSGGIPGVKVQLWYGALDSLCRPEFALQFASALGSNCEVHRIGGGHSEDNVANVDPYVLSEFLTSN